MSNIVYSFESDSAFFRVDDLFDKQIEMHSAKITESLYGDLPTIELVFSCGNDEDLYPINHVLTGKLVTRNGYENSFEGFIYSIERNLNKVTMKLLLCDSGFTKDTFVTKYTNITDAIKSTWQRDITCFSDGSIKTDVLDYQDPHYIYQRNTTNYQLCTKLCKSFKYNTVFGYGMSDLIFVDLSNPKVKKDCKLKESDTVKLMSTPTWSDPKLYAINKVTYEDYNTDQVEYEVDPNHINVRFYSKSYTVDTVYKELLGNYLYNSKLESLKNTIHLQSKILYDYQLGDFVELKSNSLNFQNTFISKRVITLDKAKVTVDYRIQSIDPWTYSSDM